MSDDAEVIQIGGNAGGEPEQRPDSEWINFSVAVTKSYTNKITRWVRVGTKKPHLVAWVKANVHKGTPIYAEGYINVDQYNGKTQYNMIAFRLGLINFAPKEGESGSTSAEGFNWGS